jgi:hypothetical protein
LQTYYITQEAESFPNTIWELWAPPRFRESLLHLPLSCITFAEFCLSHTPWHVSATSGFLVWVAIHLLARFLSTHLLLGTAKGIPGLNLGNSSLSPFTAFLRMKIPIALHNWT